MYGSTYLLVNDTMRSGGWSGAEVLHCMQCYTQLADITNGTGLLAVGGVWQ